MSAFARTRRCCAGLLLLPAALAGAHTADTHTAGPAPTLPRPALGHVSPAGPPLPPGDPPAIAWRQSNRTVGALGGHAGHLRAPRPAAPAAASAAPAAENRR